MIAAAIWAASVDARAGCERWRPGRSSGCRDIRPGLARASGPGRAEDRGPPIRDGTAGAARPIDRRGGRSAPIAVEGLPGEAGPAGSGGPAVARTRKDSRWRSRAARGPHRGRSRSPARPELRKSSTSPPVARPARRGSLPAPTVPPAPTPLLLDKALQLQDSPFRTYGWIENSFTGNANGVPRNGENFGVFPNHLADRWMGNQYYLVLENPLDAVDTVNFGYRLDLLFGNDWQFTKDYGLFDHAFAEQPFRGPGPAADVWRGPPARIDPAGPGYPGRAVLLAAGIREPASHRPAAALGALHDELHAVHVLRRVCQPARARAAQRLERDDRRVRPLAQRALQVGIHGGDVVDVAQPEAQHGPGRRRGLRPAPHLPAGQCHRPAGRRTRPGFLPGRPNPFYNKSMRGYISCVLNYKWTSKLTQVVETDHVWDPEILGYGGNPYKPHSAAYHSLGNWFLYQISPKVTGVWRSEIFWDPYGLATGNADNYHEITLGLVYKPKEYIWIRPEVRYDWTQFTHPFNDGTRNSQLTMGFDVIFLF